MYQERIIVSVLVYSLAELDLEYGVQFLERVPDGHVTRRLELIAELKEQMKQQEEMQQMMLQQQMMQAQAEQGGGPGGAAAPGGGQGDAVETSATAERRTTGFKELGEALRRVERGPGWRQSAA
jgi:hypothetical protein